MNNDNPNKDNLIDEMDSWLQEDTELDSESGSKSDKKEKLMAGAVKAKGFASQHKAISAVIAILVLLTVIRLGAFGYDTIVGDKEEASKPISVEVMTVGYSDLSASAPLSGRIAPEAEVAIVPLAAGKVTKVHVKVGDYVTAGTCLFEIDKSTVNAGYIQAKEAYNVAASNYSRMSALYEEGAISQSDLEGVRLQYLSAQNAFITASEGYNNFNVSTPIDGYVTSMSASVGNIVSQSMVASVANTNSLKIETTVSEYLASFVTPGEEVEITVASFPDEKFKGTISAFSPVPALGTLTYPITITVDNTDKKLFSGMFAEVFIKSESVKNVLTVPSNAVMVKNGKSVVAVIDDENIPTFKEVTTGLDNGHDTEILSGIKKGDTIVFSGQSFITEGLAVKVKEK